RDTPNQDVFASGLNLPFRKNSFDIVVSTDVLEHLEQRKRKTFLNELIRVTSRILILGFPHDTPVAKKADETLFEFIRRISGKDYGFLSEHLEYGLPDAEEICRLLHSKTSEILQFHNANVHSWLMLLMANFAIENEPEFQEARLMLNHF